MKLELKDSIKIAGTTAGLLFVLWMLFGHVHSKPSESKQQFEELVQEFRKFDNDYNMSIKKHPRSKPSSFVSDMN